MNAAWKDGPVPPSSARIQALETSNAILRKELFSDRKRAHRAFWRGACFGAVLAVAAFIGSAAWSQNYRCEPPDRITIESDGSDRAIVTYYNSINECSSNVDRVMEADNGISVRVIITVGSADTDYRERITLEPQDPMMMAIPPEGDLLDGEERRFVIQGGLS
jgi:hypothetical protein